MAETIGHQYRIIAAGAGWRARTDQGVIQIEGRDAFSFLHALVTADVEAMQDGHGVSAAYLTPQGRTIAAFDIVRRGDTAWILVDAADAAALAARLDALIFSEDARVSDVSPDWCQLDVVGRESATVLAGAQGCELSGVEQLGELDWLASGSTLIVRRGEAALPMFRLIAPVADRPRVEGLLRSAGCPEVDARLTTALRIEAGRPAWRVDIFEDTIPLEAGLLDRAISTTKGCYVGQEVIIRILHRGGGRVAKRLVVLVLPPTTAAIPEPGTPLLADGAPVGRTTSAALSPIRDRVVAMGYVNRDHAEIGRRITVGDATGPEAEIVALAR